MQGHADPDSKVPGDTIFTLALALNQAMHRDAAARARYAAIYGETWSPLGSADGTPYFPAPKSDTESTLARTVR